MGYYLIDHPPAVQQFYPGRQSGGWSGGVLVHTAENVMDDVGPDTGAENVAAFIARRKEYGSYHILADSDSVVLLVPPTATAFHCAADGYNSTTVGVSYACRSVDLNPDSAWTRNATDNIAGVLVRWWREFGFDPLAARFVPAPNTRTGLGLSTHGDAQPVDRSDAWTRRPDRGRLEAMFTDAIIKAAGGSPDPEDDDMKQTMVREPNGTVWLYYGGTPWRMHVKTPADVNRFAFLGVKFMQVDQDTANFFRRNSQEVKGR